MSSIFDAFFWIEPTKSDPKGSFNGTKVIWHYPDDVSAITNEFRDIPQFCFPDLIKMKLEKIQECKSEHFTFTLTGSDGKRVYGVCLRSLFRGVKRRHDVQRRPKHCLCFITRYPFFSTFRSMLLEVHAIALLEQHPGSCKLFLDAIYRQGFNTDAKMGGYVKCITASQSLIPDLRKDFNLIPPRFGRISNREIPILPLFEILGIDRFFKLLSAIMTERRVVFIADDVETLSSCVLAAASMLHPFSWHHIFIPLLPSKLLSYAAAPMPYLIGVRRYLLPELYREPLDGVLIVDLNSGEITMHGGDVVIRDLVGDSGNALKQAGENLDRMVAGVANIFKGKSSGKSGNDNDSGANRDLMVMILSDLKAILAAKPGAASIQSVASGLLRGLPGQMRSTEEAKASWTLESEKILRDNLTHFFVYLFGDLEDFIRTTPLPPATPTKGVNPNLGKAKAGEAFGHGDSRAMYDLKAFTYRRSQLGDSRLIIEFLNEFMHSQMFERYCDERITKQKMIKEGRSYSTASTASGASGSAGSNNSSNEEDDLFEIACMEIRVRQMQLTVTNAKQVVHSKSGLINGNTEGGGGKMVGTNFHPLTMQYTSSNQSSEDNTDSAVDIELSSTVGGESGGNNKYGNSMLDRICAESHWSDAFMKIMNTINFRLEACAVAKCKGSAGSAGIRAMSLLRSLLITGPECTLSYALDFIPTIRRLIKIGSMKKEKATPNSSNTGDKITAQALEFISAGAAIDPRPHALALLSLMLDHNKLIVQKEYEAKRREGNFAYLTSNSSSKTKELNSKKLGIFASKQFPKFAELHALMNTSGQPTVGAGIIFITPPELLVKRSEEDIDDVDGESVTRVASDRTLKGHSGRMDPVDPFANPFGDARPVSSVQSHSAPPSRHESPAPTAGTSRQPATINAPPPVPNKRMSVQINAPTPPPEVNLLDMDEPSNTSSTVPIQPTPAPALSSSPVVVDELKYRVLNQDTGEALDIREIARLQKLQMKQQQEAQQKAASARLTPPPATANPRHIPGTAPKPKAKSTDPFATGFGDAWGSSSNAPSSGGTDAFGFTASTTANNKTDVWSTNNKAAIDAFAPSTSWATTASSSGGNAPVTLSRPIAGAYPTSAVISSGAMNGYGGAAPRPPQNPFNAMGAMNTVNPANNGFQPSQPQQQFNSFTPSVQQPPMMPQFQVRQVGQGPPTMPSKGPPKDPFSDLVNLK